MSKWQQGGEMPAPAPGSPSSVDFRALALQAALQGRIRRSHQFSRIAGVIEALGEIAFPPDPRRREPEAAKRARAVLLDPSGQAWLCTTELLAAFARENLLEHRERERRAEEERGKRVQLLRRKPLR